MKAAPRSLIAILIPALVISLCGRALSDTGAPGKLVIIGGSEVKARDEVWRVMREERLPGRPVGIISTASEKPAFTGEPFAKTLNEAYGPDTAVFIPLNHEPGSAENPTVLAQIKQCGGIYFTGGIQTRTTKVLLQPDGQPTPALEVIRAIHRQGGVIGGSSAGAAIMSDPMITGGISREALIHGATPVGETDSPKGVSYGPGLGFSPGILYCQHHLERGRLGRLLVALTSDGVAQKTGFGISEDTAVVVDHAADEARVIGERDVVCLQAKNGRRGQGGAIEGVTLAYLTPGDRIQLSTGKITPAPGKQTVSSAAGAAMQIEKDTWERDVFRELIVDLAQTGATAASIRDKRFSLRLQRADDAQVWQAPPSSPEAPARWTLSGLELSVQPLGE